MTSQILPPLENGFNALSLTSEERELLYINLVLPSKLYTANVAVAGTGVRVYKRINPELFVLKVLEINPDAINALAPSRNFLMNLCRQVTKSESMIILNNGFIVKGGIGRNPYIDSSNDRERQLIYFKCLVDGVETVVERDISLAVIVNVSLTEEELALIPLFNESFIDSTEPATVTDAGRTRNVLREPPVPNVARNPRK